MKHRLRIQFWIESALALLSAVVLGLTLAWPNWIERLTGLEPDDHSGSVEWAIVAVSAAGFVLFAALSRRDWRRAAAA
ncbi:hypothetical protein [Nocardia niwae]|uniref:hypothetical protein n=1 Tax=Nocardia niwae TaxID=626084 RepID=UPI0033CB6AD3